MPARDKAAHARSRAVPFLGEQLPDDGTGAPQWSSSFASPGISMPASGKGGPDQGFERATGHGHSEDPDVVGLPFSFMPQGCEPGTSSALIPFHAALSCQRRCSGRRRNAVAVDERREVCGSHWLTEIVSLGLLTALCLQE